MARPSKVSVTYAFGRRDRVDPKLAPLGVLKVGKNLRVRKDGRLGVRKGYQPLSMATANGTLVAYDLHEYRGRLIALGSDAGDGYPTDLFEYISRHGNWRGIDRYGQRVVLSPFTNLHEVAGLPHVSGAIGRCAVAAGAGLVCIVFETERLYAVVVDQFLDQVVHFEDLENGALGNTGSSVLLRVVFAEGVFYVGVRIAATTQEVRVVQFEAGVDTEFQPFASVSPTLVQVSSFDMCAVSNPSTARLAVAVEHGTADLVAQVFAADGTQVGSTITITGTTTSSVSIDADEADDTINLFTIESPSNGRLRTYDFSGALLEGPTATTSGETGFMCRLPALPGFDEHVAVIVNDANGDAVIQYWDIDAHTLSGTTTVQQAFIRGRPVSGQSAGQPRALAFPALVGGDLTTFERATNALFFVTPDVAHMTTRDLLTAQLSDTEHDIGLTRDASTGRLCWPALRDSGVGDTQPVVSMLDFQSTARRQSARYGGLLYFAGGTPSVYDGRVLAEIGFNEFPAIVSLTPSNNGADLHGGATYSYVVHWEYVLADGSVELSPVSTPLSVTLGASDDRVSLVVTGPHTVRSAIGEALYGAEVTLVVSRTVWNPVSGTEGSVFRRCRTRDLDVGMGDYGRTYPIIDGEADADIAANEAIYTQADRGAISLPLAHFAPSSCGYITATEARLLLGGLPRQFEVQISKGAFLGEAFSFSPVSNFFSCVSSPVIGVHRLDTSKLVFTSDTVFALGGDGPDDVGVGTLSAPVEIPTPSGLNNPWSFLEGPDGLWFQLDDTKLFRMPRGGGSPTWEGVDIEDTLQTFPLITGACKHKADNAAVFACNADDGRARFLVRDFRTETWFEDTPIVGQSPPSGRGVDAITSLIETVCYISAGVVYRQSAADFDDDEEFIETQVRTHPLYPFGVGGYGLIYEMLLTGEYRGDCELQCRVSYNDGANFTALASFTLIAADGLVVGQTIQRKWTLPQDITSSLVVEFTTAPAVEDGDPTEGFVFNQLDLLVEAEEGLRELDPDEMA